MQEKSGWWLPLGCRGQEETSGERNVLSLDLGTVDMVKELSMGRLTEMYTEDIHAFL